jgi:hypothetical protein
MEEYAERLSAEDAEWCMREELKNYKRLALIDTKLISVDPSRPRAHSNAEFFGLAYEELVGSDCFLRSLSTGTPEEFFVVVEEGETITGEMFTDL